MDASGQLDLEVPPTFAPVTIRIRAGWERALERRRTKEYGKRYPRTEICPRCFKPFTAKGIARHVLKCKPWIP